MFSGIIQGMGTLAGIEKKGKSVRILVLHHGLGRGIQVGESVAVNGCCLTVVKNRMGSFEFELLHETWDRTTFHATHINEKVNLETSLRWGDPVGGHFVTGHVDGMGLVNQSKKKGGDLWLEITPPRGFIRWVIFKGSVTLDGVSLTVASVDKKHFGVWLIPHTRKVTTLGLKKDGDLLNLEADMLAKYAQKGGA